jgi:phosphatidylglycerophosphate synthase
MQTPTASSTAVRPPGRQSSVLRGRAPELEDPLNRYLYHRLSAHLARLLVPTGIAPNTVSVAGGLCVCAAAWAYAAVEWPVGALLGLLLHMTWHVVDGADGDLARLTGRVSPIGEMVDGLCDHVGHAILYVTLAAILDNEIGAWAWLLAGIAGVSHAFQTSHAESQRRNYLWWAYGVPWLKHAHAAGDRVFLTRNPLGSAFVGLARLYMKAAAWMAPSAPRLDALVAEVAGDPRRSARIRRLVRRSWGTSLVYEKLVGPNLRAIVLGLSMLAGSPLWYFLCVAVVLNGVLVASVAHHKAVQRRLAERLA